MVKREFLQLAHTFNPEKHRVGGWYVSEKLDGMRAYWDGGWTRGQLTSQVPFANTLKDYKRINPVRSTGLWSRYGKPIAAPEWWLNRLPTFPLDGELYLGPGRFQEVISAVKKFNPVDSEWGDIEYRIFDLPSDYAFLAPGKITNPQWTVTLDDMRDLAPARLYDSMNFHKVCRMFELGKIVLSSPAILQGQEKLPIQTVAANKTIKKLLNFVIEDGGEGLMLRKPESVWAPIRTWDLLKLKPWTDSEALVTGFTWGKGKLEGLMGAMTVEWQGKRFELSGFTDKERELCLYSGPRALPGSIVQIDIFNPTFPRGSTVTFRYRELTNDGIPKEARYWRTE